MSSDITVPINDYGYRLDFTVQDDDGGAYNLLGYTVTIKVWIPNLSSDPILTGTCSPDIVADGTCYYSVKDGDFDTVGDYLVELELTKDEVLESTRNYTLRVEESP